MSPEAEIRQQAIAARREELRPLQLEKLDARAVRSGDWIRYFGHWYSGVYFIECSNDVRLRASHIAGTIPPTITVTPVGFIHCCDEAGALALEQALHEEFADLRISRSEWFRSDERLRSYIQNSAGRWPAPKLKATP